MDNTFRDACIGVWCLSWHPATDDVRLETLSAVVRNNRVAWPGQHKAVLAVFGHLPGDVIALHEPDSDEHHGLTPAQACSVFRLHRRMGLAPAFYPVAIESAERWHWLMTA
jgi:hypothetical protein